MTPPRGAARRAPGSDEFRARCLALIEAAQEELHRVQRAALAQTPIDRAAILDAHRRYSDVIRGVIA